MKKSVLISFFLLIITQLWAQNTIDDAKNLFLEAKKLSSQGKFELAINNLEQAANIFKQNNSIKNYLICNLEIANNYLILGKTSEAENILKDIENQLITNFPLNSIQMAQFYSLRGKTYLLQNKYNLALKDLRKALRISSNLEKPSIITLLNIYNNLAITFQRLNNPDSAYFYFTKVKNFYEKNNLTKDPNYAKNLINLSKIINEKNLPDSAINLTLRAVEIIKKYFGEQNYEIAEAYNNLGNFYKNKGDIQSALNYSEKALEIKKNIFGSNSIEVANQYINVANIYIDKGDFETAYFYYQNAEQIYKQHYGANSQNLKDLYNNIAAALMINENYSFAKGFLEKSAITDTNDISYFSKNNAIVLSNLATVYTNLGELKKGRKFYKQAIKIISKLYGKNSSNLIYPYINLAVNYINDNLYDSAAYFYHKSLIVNAKNFSNLNIFELPDYNDFINPTGYVEALTGLAKALRFKALEDTNYNLIEKYVKFFFKIDTAINGARQTVINEDDKLKISSLASDFYTNAIDLVYILYQKKKNIDVLNSALYFIERTKSVLLISAMNQAKTKTFSGVPSKLINYEDFLLQKMDFFKFKIINAASLDSETVFRDSMVSYKIKYQKLLELYKKQYPKYYYSKFQTPQLSIEDLKNSLDNSTLLINYYLGTADLYTLVVSKKEAKFFKEKITKEFKLNIFYFRDEILYNKLRASENFSKISFSLYNFLFNFQISKNIKTLLIIPDKELNTIPFEALITENKYFEDFSKISFLIEKYAIFYNYSANLYYYQKQKSTDLNYDKEFLGIAPVFEGKTARRFMNMFVSPLPYTKLEIRKIAQVLNQKNKSIDTLILEQASETQVKEHLSQNKYKIIHFATHGYTDVEHPELSALLLAQDAQNDGNLFLSEIYNLKLDNKLTVLSACETGLGKMNYGEGVLGLSRAFIYAGSENLIISLWKVADKPTQELLEKFYQQIYLNETKTYSQALQEAKIYMLKQTKFKAPYFWASMILIGD